MASAESAQAAEPGQLRVDLHSHTSFSPDAWCSPRRLLERSLALGLDRIAITDHGEIAGALQARDLAPERVIVGEEIKCSDGTELIGLFLTRQIPAGLSATETAARIRDQGGLVYVPHPYAYGSNAEAHAEAALAHADLVEVFNARAFLSRWNEQASSTARARGLPGFAGSDAHFPWELGRAYTELPRFENAQDLMRAAPAACARRVRTATPLAHVASQALSRLRRRTTAGAAPSSGS